MGIALNELKFHLNDKKINEKFNKEDSRVWRIWTKSYKIFQKIVLFLNNKNLSSPMDNQSALETTKIIHALYLSDEKRMDKS